MPGLHRTLQQYANSIPAFAALLKTMLKKDIVGLGVLVARSNSTPGVVYMLPQVRALAAPR